MAEKEHLFILALHGNRASNDINWMMSGRAAVKSVANKGTYKQPCPRPTAKHKPQHRTD